MSEAGTGICRWRTKRRHPYYTGAARSISAIDQSCLIINGKVEVNSLKKGERHCRQGDPLAWQEAA